MLPHLPIRTSLTHICYASFFRPNGTLKCNSALNIELKNKGFNGKIYVEPGASSWFTGGWAKALILAGTVYLYRKELRIIGRGVLAGANLAIECWEQHPRQQDGDVKGKRSPSFQSLRFLGLFPMTMHLVFSSGDTHEKLDILDRHPAGENFHGILKVGFEHDVPHAVY